MQGVLVARVSQRLFRMLFDIQVGTQIAVSLQKRFTLFREYYDLLGTDWALEGEFLAHEYSLSDGLGQIIMTVSKEWMTWGDSYVLRVPDPRNELVGLCIVLAIDAVKRAQSN